VFEVPSVENVWSILADVSESDVPVRVDGIEFRGGSSEKETVSNPE
jgi:hypothetical protein